MSRIVRTLAVAAGLLLLAPASSLAHGFTSVVYVDATAPEDGHVHAQLGLEYDLLVVSTAENERDDAFFKAGTPAWEARDADAMKRAANAHADSIVAYVSKRFSVTADTGACTPERDGDITLGQREGVPYAFLSLDYACPDASESHVLRSELFGAGEGYVKG